MHRSKSGRVIFPAGKKKGFQIKSAPSRALTTCILIYLRPTVACPWRSLQHLSMQKATGTPSSMQQDAEKPSFIKSSVAANKPLLARTQDGARAITFSRES
jgi:hypothetical protein